MPKYKHCYFNPKWVRGRTIVDVIMNTTTIREGALSMQMHNPCFVLDNGAEIVFMAEEDPEGGEYGVQPIYRKP